MARGSRSSGRSSAPSGSRQAHTSAYPAQHAPAPAAAPPVQVQGKQPGLLAQTASTMGGAMAGSVIGHGISSMLFGGSSNAAAPPPPSEIPAQQQQQSMGMSCDVQAKDFTKCLEATNGDMSSCSYYLEALKSCQAAAKPY